MKSINETVQKKSLPVKILQYGEGNFLRGFVEYMVDVANEKGVFCGGVQIIKAVPFGSLEPLMAQDCVYTALLRGIRDGKSYVEKRVITCVNGAADSYGEYEKYAALSKNADLRFIVSNTTEAGIVFDENDDISLNPPNSYPGKLTKFLYERYKYFDGQKEKGLIILPVELIERNGEKLKECCLKLAAVWKLPLEFTDWLTECNIFCNTLVDRIVAGYPGDEIDELEREFGYRDEMIVTGEPFALWVIESKDYQKIEKEFPLNAAGLPVVFTDNLQPYRERKVRILNGAHTSSALAGYLCGLDTVGELMADKTMRAFVEKAVFSEISPMVSLPPNEVKKFAVSVMERFENPFIKHNLLSISLNSVSKFKARVLPSILDTYEKTAKLPELLCFSLAALIAFYCGEKCENGNKLVGTRNGEKYEICDDKAVLDFFAENGKKNAAELCGLFLGRVDFWDADLTQIPGFAEKTALFLEKIREYGMKPVVGVVGAVV